MRFNMATSATIPVRLPPELMGALDAWAKSIGQSRSAAIKLCLAKQLGLVEKADAESLVALDGRHYRYATRPSSIQVGSIASNQTGGAIGSIQVGTRATARNTPISAKKTKPKK